MAKYVPKTRATRASVAAFVAKQRDPQVRDDSRTLVRIMRRVTGKPARMWGPSIVGFGKYHYRYASGHEGDSCLAGFAPRKGQLTIYLLAGFTGSAALLRKLGKHKRTVACLHVKRLADIDLNVLERLLRGSVREVKKRYPD